MLWGEFTIIYRLAVNEPKREIIMNAKTETPPTHTNETMPAELARELFHYDPETGIFTEKTVRSHKNKIGDQLQGHGETGVPTVCVKRHYITHARLAFIYMQGRLPEFKARTLNGDTTDLRWGNLVDSKTPFKND